MRIRWGLSPPPFPFLFGRAFIEAALGTANLPAAISFPFLFGRAFIEATRSWRSTWSLSWGFPFLFGRAFIEARNLVRVVAEAVNFPSFLEGLSLRRKP